MNIADRNPAGVGPDNDPGKDISQNQRLPQSLRNERAKQGSNHNNDDICCYTHEQFLDSEKFIPLQPPLEPSG
jgi:hypothetical protein